MLLSYRKQKPKCRDLPGSRYLHIDTLCQELLMGIWAVQHVKRQIQYLVDYCYWAVAYYGPGKKHRKLRVALQKAWAWVNVGWGSGVRVPQGYETRKTMRNQVTREPRDGKEGRVEG